MIVEDVTNENVNDKDHKEKYIDEELRKELKEAKKLIKSNGIPFKILAVGIDHLYIQLSEEDSEYESVIAEILEGIPYKLEYGEGVKRGGPITTEEDVTNATDPTIRKNSEKLNP